MTIYLKIDQTELAAICKAAKELTHANAHGEARQIIAQKYGYENHVKAFTGLILLQQAHGESLQHHLNDRREWTKKLFEYIAQCYGRDVRTALYNCL